MNMYIVLYIIIILVCKNKLCIYTKVVVKRKEGCKVQAIVMRPCPRKRPEIFIGKQELVKLHVHLFDGFSPTPCSLAV